MSSIMDTLIIDRTQQDVANKTAIAYYNASDFNRVIQAMQYLAQLLRANGYAVYVQSQSSWGYTGISDTTDSAQYLQDLQAVCGAVDCPAEIQSPFILGQSQLDGSGDLGNGGIQAAPETLENLLWATANTIERMLLRTNQSLENLQASAVPCGTATCGGDYL